MSATLVEIIKRTTQGVLENANIPRVVVGTMLSPVAVRCGDKLVLDSPLFTETARERKLKGGDRVLCLLDMGECVVVDRI